MKIAWVLYGGLEQKTGGTIYDRMVVEGLRRAGEEVTVVSIAPGAADVAGQARACACDVVVGDELCFRELAVAFRELGGSGAKRLLLVHHLTGWETGSSIAEERAAIDECDAIVATSEATKERLVAEGARVRIDVVVPGADRLVRVERGREPEGATRFLFLGTVSPRKRVNELVRSFARAVPEGRGELAIVGSTSRDEDYVREVRATMARHDVGGRVVMTGEVDDEGVARALAGADVLVMPSSLEGWGIAATEAIRAGVPVIAARAQGLVEALAAAPDATLFADDEPALASALERFVSDAAMRERMTQAARAAAVRMPTWEGCVNAFRSACLTTTR